MGLKEWKIPEYWEESFDNSNCKPTSMDFSTCRLVIHGIWIHDKKGWTWSMINDNEYQ